jgi:hypothetical protein
MAKRQLDNLVAIGNLKREAPAASEIGGLIHSAETRLRDAENEALAVESRFDLAYNAAHALSLAALRWHGYRSEKRYIVFQALAHTLSLPATQWRVLEQAHRKRNTVEYEGLVDINEQLLEAVLRVTREIAKRVGDLGPVKEE